MGILVAVAGVMLSVPAGRAAADDSTPNSCGCYRSLAGDCLCTNKARCGCPGQCEPRGCEAKRSKLLDKEIEAETKKAADAARRQRDARTEQEDNSEDSSDAERNMRATDQSGGRGVHARAPRVVHMTPAQKKAFHRLLDLYLAEHPHEEGRTLEQASNELQGAQTAHNP